MSEQVLLRIEGKRLNILLESQDMDFITSETWMEFKKNELAQECNLVHLTLSHSIITGKPYTQLQN